jgi:DNA-binding helix-hairpin-helix protein with protein kinase domain
MGKLRSIDIPVAANSFLLLGILVATSLNLVAPKKPAAVQWEYKIESIEDYSFDSMVRRLGEDRWEITSARRATSGEGESTRGVYEVILKRPTYVSQHEIAARDKIEALEAEQLLGQLRIQSILRAEQAYHIENNNLAAAIDSLELGDAPSGSYPLSSL